jgi:hypothetical protein
VSKAVLRTPLLLVLASALLAACMNQEPPTPLPAAGVASSAGVTVGCDADEGVRATALIQALTASNEYPGADVIDLAPGCTYTLTSLDNVGSRGNNGLPVITGDLTLNGNDATIRRDPLAASDFRILEIGDGVTVVISGLTIAHGSAPGFNSGAGGGIANRGTLTVTNGTFVSNEAFFGGGIWNTGTLTLANSTFSGNGGTRGGGISNSGTLTVMDSTFSNNAVVNYASGLSPVTSLGGAISNAGSLTITNSTFSANTSQQSGAAINSGGSATTTLTVTNGTFSDNDAPVGGGIASNSGTVILRNTIMNRSPCGASNMIDGGHNLDSGTTCPFSETNDSRSNADPLLGPLQGNGGPAKTHALLTGSPAIDRIPVAGGSCNGTGVTTDQRGVSRPQGTACDIGAFEVEVERPLDIQRPSIKIEQVLISKATRAGTAEGSFVIRNASGGEDTLVTLGDVTVSFRSDGRRVRTWHTATCLVTPLATGYELQPGEAREFAYACTDISPAIPATAGEVTAVVTVVEMWNQLGERRHGPPRTTSEPHHF